MYGCIFSWLPWRGFSPSPAAWRLCRDLASGRGHKLRMSITGSLLGDAYTTGKAKSLSTKLDTLITVE